MITLSNNIILKHLKTVKNSNITFEEISVSSAGLSWHLVSEKQNENNIILSLNIIK